VEHGKCRDERPGLIVRGQQTGWNQVLNLVSDGGMAARQGHQISLNEYDREDVVPAACFFEQRSAEVNTNVWTAMITAGQLVCEGPIAASEIQY
jgi:hypothetical protein